MNVLHLLILLLTGNLIVTAQTLLPVELMQGDSIRIVVTDSGLGGLSIASRTASNFMASGYEGKVDIVFFNALFDSATGYNSLPDREAKIKQFDEVLNAISERFSPDLIIIACNTLSTFYKKTHFANSVTIPVIDIVESGINAIKKSTSENDRIIIFGTETTIQEDVYRQGLISKGYDSRMIINQSCPQLQSYIETDPYGEAASFLIQSYVEEALQTTNTGDARLYASLNCTHFGYAKDLWLQAFVNSGIVLSGIIDPNLEMADQVCSNLPARITDTNKMSITFSVFSKVGISAEVINSISDYFHNTMPLISNGLENYHLERRLF